ncbi:hypothetical protein FEM48_Zijuj11G0053500 [Ziziphus jujuba var. spinosa]|uniref:BED-type domain-containing protein n=1 Tax=Ziziphus jujuba var. spinosa TaxID=714518 RepID=A0A978UH25_ZIZJJ|nr:hypothetical protein FEM48_Zijuj11G0053500 [Ziziphus jujuba var. spinosa]
MVRGRDACWEHCVLVDANRQKVKCNYCQREFSGGVYRMKFHLAQIKNKDIVPCTEVPTNVRDHIKSILNTPKKQKTPKKPKVDQAAMVNNRENSSSASGGFHPNHGSTGQNGSTCPSLLFPHPSPSAQPILDDVQKQKQDDADKKVAAFFYHNSIPFSAAKSMYYQDMVDAIAEFGVGYKAPSYEKLRSSLLEKVKEWLSSTYSRCPEAQVIKSLLYLERFWKYAHEAVDLRLRNGFQETMLKMASTDNDKVEITKEHPLYINAQGALGTDFAIMGRTLNAPGYMSK